MLQHHAAKNPPIHWLLRRRMLQKFPNIGDKTCKEVEEFLRTQVEEIFAGKEKPAYDNRQWYPHSKTVRLVVFCYDCPEIKKKLLHEILVEC